MIQTTASPALAKVALCLAASLVLWGDVCGTTASAGATLKFVNSATPTMPGLQPGAVAVGDFDDDGNLDMAVANATDLNQPVVDTTNDVVAVFLGKGDGTFQAGVSYHVGAVPVGLLAADLNNDGKLDLVTANNLDGTVSVLLGNGDGTFQAQQVFQTGPLGQARILPQ